MQAISDADKECLYAVYQSIVRWNSPFLQVKARVERRNSGNYLAGCLSDYLITVRFEDWNVN